MEATVHNYPELFSKIQKSIDRLMRKHDIHTYGRPYKSNIGEAEPENNRIRVPKITDIYSIYVVFHEIAHVIFNHYTNPLRRPYQQEMEAEQYALKQLRRFSIHKLFPEDYNHIREEAANYVIKFIWRALEKGTKCEEISTTTYNFLKPHINTFRLFQIMELKKKKKQPKPKK